MTVLPSRVLVANRGEIAIRLLRSCAELGVEAVAVFSGDDADAPHVRTAAEAVALPGEGPAAYLDVDAVVAAARESGCDTVHPGYGFLSENPTLVRACGEAGLTFVGPSADALEHFGDKTRARSVAAAAGVPVPEGTDGPVDLDGATAFLDGLGDGASVVLKAVSGGGGRGIRPVHDRAELPAAYASAAREAAAATGGGGVYVERLVVDARHVEVQVAGDGERVVALGDRDCSVQRRHQKLVEIAPAPGLSGAVRERLATAAEAIVGSGYRGLGTVEFLVTATDEVWFLEVNPRLQVEHPVTEEVTGLDLVATGLRLAAGATLADLGLSARPPAPRGSAIQLRVTTETVTPDGLYPAAGTITELALPSGRGVRVDAAAHPGYATSPRFDPLLAKVIARGADLGAALAVARRALAETVVGGVDTTVGLLRALLDDPAWAPGESGTDFLDTHLSTLAAGLGVEPVPVPEPDGTRTVTVPTTGTVVTVDVGEGDEVAAGTTLVVLEAMKMEHPVVAPTAGIVRRIDVAVGDTPLAGTAAVHLEERETAGDTAADVAEFGPDHVRDDLDQVLRRRAIGLDAARPDAVARRRRTGRRTARENLDDLVDPGTFVEYGALAIAAQRRRRTVDDLVERTPADGLVAGTADVSGHQVVVMSYDYTVLAGTQGAHNHKKKDRLFELAEQRMLPLVVFCEGGGGRPGDTDGSWVSMLDVPAFHLFGRLSGRVPLVGIVSGYCFAGNAALAGCCDVVIATEDANLGMGGPAMIEGGGLGVVEPREIGPMRDQVPNGVVDVLVADEAEAVDVARRYLSYFQGPQQVWEAPDQRLLRHVVPENRVRVYDVRAVIDGLADTGSVLELRRGFAAGIVTALVRVEGRPMGLLANDPTHLGGAIDRDGADKAARFMQLCDAFGLPIVSLVDTPGFMVGPESERTATVRHFSRMFVVGANVDVPIGMVVVRKCYGLGGQSMGGGSTKAPQFCVAWPTGEFGGMGLEGAVRLGFRKELEAVDDPVEREALYRKLVAEMYEQGKATNTASVFEIDDVIDPVETRRWIVQGFRGYEPQRMGARRPNVDTW
ncbi:MAG: ATP-grasp domain-containing protein [Pseudonocardia sp.]|uniref:acetyl-CoA carboxylase family protein n=1 Tax=unclassified Pseudonocardia TaxID=2619320 RepID=UPI00086ADE8D|nr:MULTISPECIES: carboxyl transferase domain-containing protein [unclassified Pseudonocardia]MBN9111296.1 ATP-grasp domain-containing protein [Pseudonocardia sp.]ODU24552.1 MAG: carbamoyl-phosphate synthase large subunit [Pseudonocardia sp. SCN 72-51]ODV06263.1 MAG: carbamoyl-phosphate synthase large subunit [Pseudonocardia sp. SCN 73-27]